MSAAAALNAFRRAVCHSFRKSFSPRASCCRCTKPSRPESHCQKTFHITRNARPRKNTSCKSAPVFWIADASKLQTLSDHTQKQLMRDVTDGPERLMPNNPESSPE